MIMQNLSLFMVSLLCVSAADTKKDLDLNKVFIEYADTGGFDCNKISFIIPNITNLEAISPCSLNISWECAICDGAFVEKYTIYWSPSNSTEAPYKKDINNDTQNFIIEDLFADTEYEVIVSSHILRQECKSSPETEITLEGEPGNVTGLNYTKITENKIYLRWDESENGCSAKEYKIQFDGTVLWKKSTRQGEEYSTTNFHTLTNLIPYTSYTISVAEVTSDGTEGDAAVIEEIVTDDYASDAPESIASTSLNSSSIKVSWNEPLVKNGFIIEYLVSWRMESDTEDDFKEQNTTELYTTVNGLLACGNYTFNVVAVNGAGNGEPATTQERTQPESPPPVENLNATNSASRSVYLRWTPPDTNCPVSNYTIEGVGEIFWNKNREDKLDVTFKGRDSNYVLRGLTPSTGYNVSLKPTTEGGTGEPMFVAFETIEDVPSAPTNLNAVSISKSKVNVSWSEPNESNGELTSYNVTWLLEGSEIGFNVFDANTNNFIIEDLLPCVTYEVSVKAATSVGEGSPAREKVTLYSEVPPPPESLECNTTGPNSISLDWDPPQTTCDISYYEIKAFGDILWKDEETSVGRNVSRTKALLDKLSPYTSYNISVRAVVTPQLQGGSSFCTALTEEDVPGQPVNLTVVDKSEEKRSFKIEWYDPKEKNGVLIDFLIEKNNSTYKTVPSSQQGYYKETIEDLDHDTKYIITVSAQTSKGYGESSETEGKTAVGSQAGLIIGIIIAIAIVASILGFGFYYRKDIRRKMTTATTTYGTQVGTTESTDNFTTTPIPLSQLKSHIQHLERDRNLELEYKGLSSRSYSGPDFEGKKPENELKNRYANIIPFDASRTILHESQSDYINASHINSFLKPRFFIAAQGPKDNTVEDFWNLLWQENVDIIVMLTICVESGREKCSQYWPNSMAGFGSDIGNLSIQNINEEITSLFVIRVFEVTNRRDGHKRLIKHFQFNAWPDFAAPSKEEYLLKLLFTVRQNLATNRTLSKMLVHCSAGVGRTGTFISLWNIIEEIESGIKSISISKEVLELRRQRPLMVQSKEQYLYLYKCVLHYCENQEKWSVKSRASSKNLTDSTEEASTSAYYNMAFEQSQDFQGNLI